MQNRVPKPHPFTIPTVSNLEPNLRVNWNSNTGQRLITTAKEAAEDSAKVAVLNPAIQQGVIPLTSSPVNRLDNITPLKSLDENKEEIIRRNPLFFLLQPYLHTPRKGL